MNNSPANILNFFNSKLEHEIDHAIKVAPNMYAVHVMNQSDETTNWEKNIGTNYPGCNNIVYISPTNPNFGTSDDTDSYILRYEPWPEPLPSPPDPAYISIWQPLVDEVWNNPAQYD